jgi:hypothetical protein
MPDNSNKRCPQCGGAIDYFDSCRKCGREWSESLEPEELEVLKRKPYPSTVKKVEKPKPKKNRFTKSKDTSRKYSSWQIDADFDDEDAIIKKRSLMRLDSRKLYNALGISMRAHDAQKASLMWLSRLWEFLSEDEQKRLAPTVEYLKQGFSSLRGVVQAKIAESAEMEMALENAHKEARRAGLRMAGERFERSKVKSIKPHEDTEGYSNPEPAVLDPKLLVDPSTAMAPLTKAQLIEQAKEKLSNLDQEKALQKKRERPTDGDPTESE